VGSVESHLGAKVCCLVNELSDIGDQGGDEEEQERLQAIIMQVQACSDARTIEGLLQGRVQLPMAASVQDVSGPIPCRHGCGEQYCCCECEAAAWSRHHCLLCPAVDDGAQRAGRGTARSGSRRGGSSSGSGGSSSNPRSGGTQRTVHGVHVNSSALRAFYEHADSSNEVFRLAAQVVATMLVAADRLLAMPGASADEEATATAAYSAALATAHGASKCVLLPQGQQQQQQDLQQDANTDNVDVDACLAALQAAWLPYAVAHKAPWWEVVRRELRAAAENAGRANSSTGAGSDDCDSDSNADPDEVAEQTKQLAAESLGLLRSALCDSRFPQLFDLEVRRPACLPACLPGREC
jgi:hypothetical protein